MLEHKTDTNTHTHEKIWFINSAKTRYKIQYIFILSLFILAVLQTYVCVCELKWNNYIFY